MCVAYPRKSNFLKNIQCFLEIRKIDERPTEVHNFRGEIVAAVRRMIDPARRCDFERRVAEIANRAVFEIPDILGRILRLSDAAPGRHRFHPAFPGRPGPG